MIVRLERLTGLLIIAIAIGAAVYLLAGSPLRDPGSLLSSIRAWLDGLGPSLMPTLPTL